MVKFLLFAVGALSALVTGATAAPQCVPLNFLEKAADFDSINGLLDVAVTSGLLKGKLAALDPLTITDKRLDALPLSILGTEFTLTPIIQTLTAKGVSTVVPAHLNATAPSNIDLGASFTGEVTIDATLRFEIAQVNHQWWQVCWTNIWSPKKCPPALLDVDVGLGLNKPTVATNVLVAMLACSPNQAGQQGEVCTDLSVNDIISAALGGQIDTLLARILRRIKEVSLNNLKLGFDQITKLNIHFHNSGPLVTELGKKLLGYSAKEINKKGPVYKGLIEVTNKLGKNLVNKLIKEKLAPKFGNSCYDPAY